MSVLYRLSMTRCHKSGHTNVSHIMNGIKQLSVLQDVQLMYDSLEVPKDQRDPENTEKLHRFETIHITGFSTKVQFSFYEYIT